MPALPPLTRNIGQAERALQALLVQHLAPTRTTFAEWAALTLLYGAGRMSAEQLGGALAKGNIAGADEAVALINSLVQKGTIGAEAGALVLTPQGERFYEPLRAKIAQATDALFTEIAPEDIDATRRTLDLVARRAAEMTEPG